MCGLGGGMAGDLCDATEQHLLLIEDDAKLGDLVQRFLQAQHYQVSWAKDGATAEKLCRQQLFDLIICDVMLPDSHGFTLYERLQRDANTPCLFLTALGDDHHHIEGLERGAVDYLVKPVAPDVLLARVRRHLAPRQQHQQHRHIELEELIIDAATRTVSIAHQALDLTRKEFDLLWLFAQYPNTVLHRDQLFSSVTERDYDGQDRTIDGRISRLRKKLEQAHQSGWTVQTVWGRGYMFCRRSNTAP
jgi:DNA-binding response OmpR family regulator